MLISQPNQQQLLSCCCLSRFSLVLPAYCPFAIAWLSVSEPASFTSCQAVLWQIQSDIELIVATPANGVADGVGVAIAASCQNNVNASVVHLSGKSCMNIEIQQQQSETQRQVLPLSLFDVCKKRKCSRALGFTCSMCAFHAFDG